MSSSAISAQGSKLEIGTGSGAAINISAIALTYPLRVTLASVTGLNKGDVLNFAGVGGTVELNGKSLVIEAIEPTSKIVTFAGVDATAYTAFTTGGTVTPVALTKISNLKDFSGFDGAPSEIDVTNLDSTAKEFRLGLVDFGQMSITIDQDNSDPGQQACRTAQVAGTLKQFKLTLPNAVTATFNAYVKKFPTSGGVDAVVKSTMDLRISGAVTWA